MYCTLCNTADIALTKNKYGEEYPSGHRKGVAKGREEELHSKQEVRTYERKGNSNIAALSNIHWV